MVRLSAIYVAFCMVLIAVSIGAVLFLGFGLSGPEASIVGIAALAALALYDAVAQQLRARAVVDDQIANLARGMGDLARQTGELTRQLGELRQRLAAAEQKTDPAAEQARAAIPTITADIDELGLLVHQLAETVAAHESTISEQSTRSFEPVAQPMLSIPPVEEANIGNWGETAVPESAVETLAPPPARTLSNEEKVAFIRAIIDANRADLFLQPIVSLPQRRVRYYETFTRLRNEDGSLLMPDEFLGLAELGGLMPRIDHLVLTRAAQIVRRLLSKNRDIGLICNISTQTLTDPQSFQQLQQFFDANQELMSSLVLELPQSFWRASRSPALANLSKLSKIGARCSMDRVTDLQLEPRELAERGIRLIKVPARLLLNSGETREFDIHPGDLSDLMARFGIGLIAEHIEDEETVAEMLDLEVRLGQGFVFSLPRPVRADVLQEAEEEARRRENAKTQRSEALAQRSFAEAIEEMRRGGILPQAAPGGSRA